MDLYAVSDQVRALLQQRGRLAYRMLTLQFQLDDKQLEAIKEEIIDIQQVAADKDGKMLVWTGGETSEEMPSQTPDVPALEPSSSAPSAQPEREAPSGERRQLTVMFCDLVGSTSLSEQLDPEELQTVVRTYQEVSAQVIERHDGYIAQYLGDGLLVYFGYPAAHEDDAARAIRAGLEIVAALRQARSQFPQPVHVRVGIHTGPVVVSQMGGGSRHEQLALGETPNVAARVQGQAQPDEVVISAATQRLVVGLFETQDRGSHALKGISALQALSRVTAESTAQNRFEVAVRSGLTPLVGRETEIEFLRERWRQAQASEGQFVLLSGEPGIGKSRLVQEVKAQTLQDGAPQIELRCSPYYHNSTLYPVIEHLQQLLQFTRDDTGETKLQKLQHTLSLYRFPTLDSVPLLAALLSLPQPPGFPALTLSPQKQREKTQATVTRWLLEAAQERAVVYAWEDLHWADPSTLELLGLFLAQVSSTRILTLLTYRPEFSPPWAMRSHMTQFTLNRLGQTQIEALVEKAMGGKTLPQAVVQEVVKKTDGVPLFVEEVSKMLVESGVVIAANGQYELSGPLSSVAIPATLQDSLMARLDRLQNAKAVAQLGATIGREFSYELLHAIAPLDETTLQHGLQQLVDAELIHQRGFSPDTQYQFKHALVQDTAYQSLLKRKREQIHQKIARVLEVQFPKTVETQPELLAYHFTEAGLVEQAVPYWQRAGQRANQRSASSEAISHLTTGLQLLKTVPETPERIQHELLLHITLGIPLAATKGFAAPEVGEVFTRARELSQQVSETPQHLSLLQGLFNFYVVRGELQTYCCQGLVTC